MMFNSVGSGRPPLSFPGSGNTWELVQAEQPSEIANTDLQKDLIFNEADVKTEFWGEKLTLLTRKLFDALLKNIHLLSESSNCNDKALCEAIFNHIQALIDITKNALQQGEVFNDQLNEDLINAHEALSGFEQCLKSRKNGLRELEEPFESLNQKKGLLEEEYSKNEVLIKELEAEKLREKQARENLKFCAKMAPDAFLLAASWTPLNKNPTDVVGKGIASYTHQKVEFCTKKIHELSAEKYKLSLEINSINNNIQEYKRTISFTENKIVCLSDTISLQEKNIKELGKNLTIIRNINSILKMILVDCSFLKKNITDTISFGDLNKEKQGLEASVRAVQVKFNEIFNPRITKIFHHYIFNYNFEDKGIIQKIVDQPDLKEKMEKRKKVYSWINDETAMQNLIQVGKSLRLAYEGSLSFPYKKQILKTIRSYQSLIADTQLAVQDFVSHCLIALKMHKSAANCAEEKQLKQALEVVSQSSELAEKMAKISKKLSKKSNALYEKARETFAAVANEIASEEKKQKIKEEMQRKNDSQRRLRNFIDGLEIEVEKEIQREQVIAEEIKKFRQQPFNLELISTAIEPMAKVGREYLNSMSTTRKLFNEFMTNVKADSDNKQQENESVLEKLDSPNTEVNALEQETPSLKLSLKTLEKISSLLSNVHFHWKRLAELCKELTDVKDLTLCSELGKIIFQEALVDSACSWATLGKINLVASHTIRDIDCLKNLPTEEELTEYTQ